jgi:hypothetical protein
VSDLKFIMRLRLLDLAELLVLILSGKPILQLCGPGSTTFIVITGLYPVIHWKCERIGGKPGLPGQAR